MNPLPALIAAGGVGVGSGVTSAWTVWMSNTDRAEARRRELDSAGRERCVRGFTSVSLALGAANDFLDSWYGHQPNAPRHNYELLLRDA